MRQRQTLGNRNVVGCNITRIREAKNIGQGELLRKIQLLGVDMNAHHAIGHDGRDICDLLPFAPG